MYNQTIIEETNKIKELEIEYTKLKGQFANILDRDQKKYISEQAKKVKEEHDNKIGEKKITSQILNEFKFMKGIDTLEKFKKKIRTCQFWAETWSISTLEKILNIKIKNLNIFLKKSLFNRSPSIYKKHTTTNALIEIYNKNRKLARKLRYDENCQQYLLLKNSTSNFKKL